jgi:hypothetical protein
VGARGFDSLAFSEGVGAAATMRALGLDYFVGYLGVVSPARVVEATSCGLGFMAVTLAGRYDGAQAVAQCRALGLPSGVTVWLDLEGQTAFKADPVKLAATVNAWADAVASAGFMPGLYVGSPQPFTSVELFALRVVRYWHGQGSARDRQNELAEPTCGWCMAQDFPSVNWRKAPVLVDVDHVSQDYRGRVPAMAMKVAT